MKINYNDWFNRQYNYLIGNRKGIKTYNDTKWVNINKRYKKLINIESELLNDQPFGVVGNNTGFNKLIDLMGKSNYTFNDINDSLVEAYKISLKNAMGSMVVNTHAVMFATSNINKSNVSSDKFTHYYIIDAPFNQLHFGERDEFVRQKLHEMHSVDTEHYIPMKQFVTSEISDLLEFSIICTINGYICNDCQVAISDKGFKFKVGWPYSSDVKFIVYKLDEAKVISQTSINVSYINNASYIPYQVLGTDAVLNKSNLIGKHCVVNIYDENFIKTVPSVVNFGTFTNNGFEIKNIQNKTLSNISMNKSKTVNITIYILKYLNEVPNVYPACNYYDITDSHRVYSENGALIDNVNGDNIYASNIDNVNYLEKSTPPIVLDKEYNSSFKTILQCLSLYDDLIQYNDLFKSIGQSMLLSNTITQSQFVDKIIRPIDDIYDDISDIYVIYLKGAILTSLVSESLITKFKSLLTNLDNIRKSDSIKIATSYNLDEFYGDNYKAFVKTISSPFTDNILSNFKNLADISDNYFTDDNSIRFNRPVSEQCFIALRYNRIDKCWLFDYPNIKHFKGIGNTFYIDDNLNGDEVFKFFVLYTDTNAPKTSDCEISPMSLDTVFDFDKFNDEIEKHMGYVKYFQIENKLMKICKIIYNKYDSETCVQVLSKILKHKIDGEDILSLYPSDINYEASNITSDDIANMSDDSDRGPFSINFLFYTLNMMQNKHDKLQTYFMKSLVNNKYNKRYADIDISDVIDDELCYPINYSQFVSVPDTIDISSSILPSDDKSHVYYGLPLIIDNSGNVSSNIDFYKYAYNIYNIDVKYNMIIDNGIDESNYVMLNDLNSHNYEVYSYHNDITACKLATFYLTAIYDYIADLQTYYTSSFNQDAKISSCVKTCDTFIKTFNDLLNKENVTFIHPDTLTIINSIVNDNPVISAMSILLSNIDVASHLYHNNKRITLFNFCNSLLSLLKNVYITTGFDLYTTRIVRKMYLYLKEINNIKSIYKFKQWLLNFDTYTLSILDSLLATNENYVENNNVFKSYYDSYMSYKDNILGALDKLYANINDLSVSLYENHLQSIVNYCDDIIKNYIINLYIIDKINYNVNETYTTKPVVISITLPKDGHFTPNIIDVDNDDTNVTLIFKPICVNDHDTYRISSICKICEYCIFTSNTISDCDISILDENMSVIKTIKGDVSFKNIGTTVDPEMEFDQINNLGTTCIDIQNIHEDMNVDNNDYIVNNASSDMNYELLMGNQFMQLPHEHEYVLNPKTMTHGPVDRIIIENQLLNDLVNSEYINHTSNQIFFKPCQVKHLIPSDDDNVITSVGGKYYVGQTLYVKTIDDTIAFPIIVTATDHNISKGFIEAKIDSLNCKWFNITDETKITQYLTSDIECEVLNDNVCNFIDEYSNTDYNVFANAKINNNLIYSDENSDIAWSMLGDPIYVQNNSQYVYTRLNWMFSDSIPNRFIDETSKRFKFAYLGEGEIIDINDSIQLKMINHDFNNITDCEMYPILRTEPNDHAIWDLEIKTFNEKKDESLSKEAVHKENIDSLTEQLINATTEYDQNTILASIESEQYKINYEIAFRDKMDALIEQLEQPTSWFNVRSYETAMIYISNGRAKTYPTIVPSIKDMIYSDKLKIYLYDWEHKYWINTNLYEIETNMIDSIQLDEYDNYNTNQVLYSIIIKPLEEFVPSKKILLYYTYETSDVFNNIILNDNKFYVKFKPVLSLNKINNNDSLYSNIHIRKHLDGNEKYILDEFNKPDDFSIDNSFHINRISRSGKYPYTPTFRLCDVSLINNDIVYSHDDIDIYVRIPFKDVTTTSMFNVPSYSCSIKNNIDFFEPNMHIELICVQNNEVSSYTKSISNITFEGITSYDMSDSDNPIQKINIIKSSINNIDGKFICYTNKSDRYRMYGDIVVVTISHNSVQLIDPMSAWIKLPSVYQEIPVDEFIVVPHDNVLIDDTKQTEIVLSNKYIKAIDDIIMHDNSNLSNPFEYYFDETNHIKYPISDIHQNNYNSRLVIDQELNPDVKLIKSTYISICRYSLRDIPSDGKIDLTGYLPTPLSRNRYEFWVNGRFINKDDVIILSPTSIQLCNLKSLHNFELIELVDDINASDIINENTIYIDINGKLYSSFENAIASNYDIIKQNVRFTYNVEQHQDIDNYSSSIITNPNNNDIESDIFNNIIQSDDEVLSYNSLHNLPSMNGILIKHLDSTSLGIVDIPSNDIISLLDKTWKCEIISNPLFTNTHRTDIVNVNNSHAQLHLTYDYINDVFLIKTAGSEKGYFSLYISNKSDCDIDDIDNTLKIIPFIKIGVNITITSEYSGKWLCSTCENCKPILIK